MKKILSLGFVLMLALTIQAQNYPQPFGIKVGQSTLSEVLQKLTNLGIEYYEDEEKIKDLKDFLYEKCLDGIQRDNELEK